MKLELKAFVLVNLLGISALYCMDVNNSLIKCKNTENTDVDLVHFKETLEDQCLCRPVDNLTVCYQPKRDTPPPLSGRSLIIRHYNFSLYKSGKYLTTLSSGLEWLSGAKATISKDDKIIITVAVDTDLIHRPWDIKAKIWDKSGKCLFILHGHKRSIYSVATSHDGTFIVTGSGDKTAKIWDVKSGKCLTTLSGHNGSIYSVAISHDDTFIVTGSEDKTAKIWDVKSGNCLATLYDHNDTILFVEISDDDRFIITKSDYRIWKWGRLPLLRDRVTKWEIIKHDNFIKIIDGDINFIYSENTINTRYYFPYKTKEYLEKEEVIQDIYNMEDSEEKQGYLNVLENIVKKDADSTIKDIMVRRGYYKVPNTEVESLKNNNLIESEANSAEGEKTFYTISKLAQKGLTCDSELDKIILKQAIAITQNYQEHKKGFMKKVFKVILNHIIDKKMYYFKKSMEPNSIASLYRFFYCPKLKRILTF